MQEENNTWVIDDGSEVEEVTVNSDGKIKLKVIKLPEYEMTTWKFSREEKCL